MNYIFALEEGKFDKYICLEDIIDILCCFSEYTTYYVANYLKYYKFHNITIAYYIDVDSAEVLPINNQQEVFLSLFKDITELPLTLNHAREIPIDLVGRLSDVYFIREDLNKLDIFNKFGSPDFTNHKIVDEIDHKKYEDEKILIGRKLYELVVSSRIEVKDKNLINIEAVPNLIGRLFYQFVIKFDKLVLMSTKDFLPKENQFVATIDSKQEYFDLAIESEQQKDEVKVLMEQVKNLKTENEILKAKLNDELNKTNAKLANTPADDVELNPKTQAAVTRLLNVLFHKAQLDISAHKGTTNKNIVNSSISLNAKVTEKPVSHWIKQVQQLSIDTEKI
ncbi:hypothetical protein QO189_10590 [Psychrobacter sp. Arc29]|uniref:hypothetical protein n=1 Tax=Psychrobacter sp. Arc29 TaxID=3046690 RepID=UPI00352C0D3A